MKCLHLSPMYSICCHLIILFISVMSAPAQQDNSTMTLQMSRKDSPFDPYARAIRSTAFVNAKYSSSTLNFATQSDSDNSSNNRGSELVSIQGAIDKFKSIFSTNPPKPAAAPSTAAPTSEGEGNSTALLNKNNELFVVPVTLGNGQVFNLDLDTGSSDTWFRGPKCQSRTDKSCVGKAVDLADPSLVKIGKSFITNYGSGAVIGDMFNAPVAIGKSKATISVGISTAEKGFGVGTSDGLMGIFMIFISNRTCF